MMKNKGVATAAKLTISIPPPPRLSLSDDLRPPEPIEPGMKKKKGVAGAANLTISIPETDDIRAASQPEPIEHALDNQLSIADFDSVKVIGKGSSGIVRLVIHKWTSQYFALKTIRLDQIDESARRHVAQELKINRLYTSRCPHIVTCHNSFYDNNGSISILLEYMDAGSLSDFLKKVHIIPEQFLSSICKQVLKGLWYLHHEKHIIHRDLKPSNLLMNHSGEVKITDFGVSTILASTSAVADTLVGTYQYMSPERINSENYGYRSDIWSLGLVLLECVTGQFPYPPPHPDGWVDYFELMDAIVNRPAPRPPPEEYSPEFCSFISACVQKDPRNRLSTNELLVHPFITKHENLDMDLALYFTIGGSRET